MNMAILIVPMKLAQSKVSKKHLDFENQSIQILKIAHWILENHHHILIYKWASFEFCAEVLIFLMNFFSLNKVFRRFWHNKNPAHFKFEDQKLISITISQSFVKIGSKTKKIYSQDIFCKQTADTLFQLSQKVISQFCSKFQRMFL